MRGHYIHRVFPWGTHDGQERGQSGHELGSVPGWLGLSYRHNFRVFLDGNLFTAGFRICGDVAQFLPVPRLPRVPASTQPRSLPAVTAGMVTVQAQVQDRMKPSLEVVGWASLGPKWPIPWLERHKLVSEHPFHHRQRCRSALWFPEDVYTSAALL